MNRLAKLARLESEHDVARETPPMTPESEEVFRQMWELINEWQETQNR